KERLKAYLQKAKELIDGFQHFTIIQIPRAENAQADLLAKLTTTNEDEIPKSVPIQYVTKPSINEVEAATVLLIDSG
ncbi:hypothetical protein PJP07_31390, partial [Mycobacterium kansasii]